MKVGLRVALSLGAGTAMVLLSRADIWLAPYIGVPGIVPLIPIFSVFAPEELHGGSRIIRVAMVVNLVFYSAMTFMLIPAVSRLRKRARAAD